MDLDSELRIEDGLTDELDFGGAEFEFACRSDQPKEILCGCASCWL